MRADDLDPLAALRVLGATDRLDRGDDPLPAGERERLLERVRVFERAARQRVADLRTQLARAEEFAATLADRLGGATAGEGRDAPPEAPTPTPPA
ncbi:hypothetical protein ACIQFW_17045 [Streptomyces ardesiacus]|uniref:hypothetical protein n=1 Tax=Streptomyces ardesiacus TaxID=285564 RepID=UPI003800AED0